MGRVELRYSTLIREVGVLYKNVFLLERIPTKGFDFE